MIIAPKGRGKTHLISHFLLPEKPRVAVFDMVHEAGYLFCCVPIANQPRVFAEALRQENFHVAYRPVIYKNDEGELYTPEFEPFVKLCYLRGNMCMAIDEAHQICSPHSIPEPLLNAVQIGRHRNLDMIFITQSWSGIHRSITRNADEFYFFKTIEPSDLDGIQSRCGRVVAQKVSALVALERKPTGEIIRLGECLHWTNEAGVVEVINQKEKAEQQQCQHQQPVEDDHLADEPEPRTDDIPAE